MKRVTPPSPRRGIALLEMLFCIIFVTIAFGIASHLIRAVVRLYHDTPAAAGQMSAQTQWGRMLREDAWSAHRVDLADGTRLAIDGDAIVWRCEGGTLLRETVDGTLRWRYARPLRWARDGAILSVTDGDAAIPLATPAQSVGAP